MISISFYKICSFLLTSVLILYGMYIQEAFFLAYILIKEILSLGFIITLN